MKSVMDKKELHHIVLKEQCNICQSVALKKGVMVYSDTWHDITKENAFHIASATKSIMSLLIGIAIDKGFIESTQQKVLDFFPDYQIKRGEKTIQHVTLEHLLTMTAPYKYKSEPWTKVCKSEDWTKAVLNLLGGRAGITGEFKYSTLGIQILSAIITKVSGLATIEFANRFLFEPLGIAPRASFSVKSKAEHIDFVTSKSPKKEIWFCDSNQIATAGFGLCLSAKELVKIGQMCLDKGVYQGKQIVSSWWIQRSTTAFVQCGKRFNNMAYGYLWWIVDAEKNIYAAIGDGGNVLYINTSAQIVISVTSTFKPAVFDRIEFIQEYIEPFVENYKCNKI